MAATYINIKIRTHNTINHLLFSMERRIFARRILMPLALVFFDVGVLVLFDSNEDTEKCRSALSIEESDVVDWTSDDEEETINKSSVSFSYKNFC